MFEEALVLLFCLAIISCHYSSSDLHDGINHNWVRDCVMTLVSDVAWEYEWLGSLKNARYAPKLTGTIMFVLLLFFLISRILVVGWYLLHLTHTTAQPMCSYDCSVLFFHDIQGLVEKKWWSTFWKMEQKLTFMMMVSVFAGEKTYLS